ncbi:prephenate dehydrogenase [Pirellulales bacterium]|nr:prephenate dehydrogenase [Pirellulales bacterium]
MPQYSRIAVIGVGLIGGSIALAARQRGLAAEVAGIGRRQSTLDVAVERGAIQTASTKIEDVAGAELVVVATPVDLVGRMVRAAGVAAPDAILTDAASTKAKICRELAPDFDGRFVGSHPLAGDHRRGPEHATGDLFEGRTVVVAPTDGTPPELTGQISDFWRGLGARVVLMAPDEHDRALAATSHLPHLVAAGLAAATPAEWLSLAATGWSDTTRIAAGDAEMWTQIFAANRECVLLALEPFDRQVRELRAALESENWDQLQRLLLDAKRTRDALGD